MKQHKVIWMAYLVYVIWYGSSFCHGVFQLFQCHLKFFFWSVKFSSSNFNNWYLPGVYLQYSHTDVQVQILDTCSVNLVYWCSFWILVIFWGSSVLLETAVSLRSSRLVVFKLMAFHLCELNSYFFYLVCPSHGIFRFIPTFLVWI